MLEIVKEKPRPIVITDENADELGFTLGKKLGQIGDRAITEINALTERFGIEARIQIVLIDKDTGKPITHD